MKITVQIAIQPDEGQAAVFQQVACLERGALRPDTLGLSLAEARSILAGLEQTMAERQAAKFVAQARGVPVADASARAKATTQACFALRNGDGAPRCRVGPPD
jgi:hypothetical protein